MEKIGKAAESALVRSPKGSVPARRRDKIITPPPRVDHFADIAIPNRVWSAFIPTGTQPRTVVRALMEHERLVIERRIASLEPALLPFDDRLEGDDVAVALAEMFESFRSMAGVKDQNAAARIKQSRQVLSDLPAWAIIETCLTIRRSGYRTEDGKLEQTWPPSDARIHAMVVKLIEGRRVALLQAKALLAAPVEATVEEAPAPGIEASLADFKARMAASGAAINAQEEALHAQRASASKEEQLEQRRQEYRNAGLAPPPTKYGFLISLSMMLNRGWTVAEVNGERVLVAPASTEDSA